MARKKTHEEFINEIKEKFGNKYTILEEYQGAKVKISVRHNDCGNIWEISPTNLLTGYGCPVCNGGSQRTHKNFVKIIDKMYPGQYKIIDEYINARTPISVQHLECGNIWKISPDNLKRGKGCPKCNLKGVIPHESKRHIQIREFLKDLEVPFENEKTFPDLKKIKRLRFDFCIYKKNYEIGFLLEYDGELHFNKQTKQYKECNSSDILKNDYCKKNNIKLLRVNYKQSIYEIKECILKYIEDMV